METFDHIRLIDPTTGSPKKLELPVITDFPNARGGLRPVASHDEIVKLGEEAAGELIDALKD